MKCRVTVTKTIRGGIADLKENVKQKKQISEHVIDLTETASVADTVADSVATGKLAKNPNQHPDFKY